MSPIRLSAIFRRSLDPTALASWYAKNLFEQSVHEALDSGEQTGLTVDGLYFGFEPIGDSVLPERMELWFSVEDVLSASDRLQQLGAVLETPPDFKASPGEVLVVLSDPEGNFIGLVGPSSDDDRP